MKSGFKDPIGVKDGKSIKSPWNFDAPPYDERSSCFVNAGTNYGVGHTQPVGKKGNPAEKAATLPQGKVKAMKDDHVQKGRVSNLEIIEKN